jgi:hypothetical protein
MIVKDLRDNLSFVVKTHDTSMNLSNVSVFSSGDDRPSYSLHHQTRENLVTCSMCEIDSYQSIFGLSDDELQAVKKHMTMYEKIRKCCGLQMSKFNRLRLHGCDVTPFQHNEGYPWCENYNMTEIELEFEKSPIPYVANSAKLTWEKPGDCARHDAEIIGGQDFNGHPFKDCASLATKFHLYKD